MFLGNFELCLNVKELRRSLEFYETLGFKRTGGTVADGWAIIETGNCRIGLYEGHIESNLINFRGGDVFALAAELKKRGLAFSQDAYREPDGSAGAILPDPDGNVVYFNTFPEEQVEFVEPEEVQGTPDSSGKDTVL
ncbi:MAG: VOC family protein [bacterium]|nr:VOC family protein [bacterium]